jgi:hypothetical protein
MNEGAVMGLVFLSIFIAVAVRCPDTVIGRFVQSRLIAPIVRWVNDLTWRRAAIAFVASAATVGLILVMPEFAVLVGAVDMTVLVELTLLVGFNATRLRWTRMVEVVRPYAVRMLTVVKAAPRARTLRAVNKARKAKSDDSDGAAWSWRTVTA